MRCMYDACSDAKSGERRCTVVPRHTLRAPSMFDSPGSAGKRFLQSARTHFVKWPHYNGGTSSTTVTSSCQLLTRSQSEVFVWNTQLIVCRFSTAPPVFPSSRCNILHAFFFSLSPLLSNSWNKEHFCKHKIEFVYVCVKKIKLTLTFL